MKIKWLAHACFLIEGDGLRILTDPYEPNEVMNLPPVTELADIVIRSSADDEAHCFIDTIPPGFELVTATEIVDGGVNARGLTVQAIWSQESHVYKTVVRDNAMYRFALEGIQITHMGDVGNALTASQMEALIGTDILLALAGGPPTIELADLHEVIRRIRPKVVIPMHYRIPGPRFFMLPVSSFTDYYPPKSVRRLEESQVTFDKASLPEATEIVVLQPALTGNS